MREYSVGLYRATDCKRGWLAYMREQGRPFDVVMHVCAENSAQAKSKAITEANQRLSEESVQPSEDSSHAR